ncbi:RNA-directed DNA polymerase, eukaryota, reverse transcriptase zinc-binding domain protein [Tanacetum coccineum]
MVEWVMMCVSTTGMFGEITVAGTEDGAVDGDGGRGLRQGDHISPYLFTLVMEILTLIIKRKVEQNDNFQYRFGCKKLKITNVCFADDLLMFCHADKVQIRVKECKSLINKVESRISNWKNKCLSYAVRLMLVASVLESIHVYLASIFLLPVGVIKDINKQINNFLWNHNDCTKGRARVVWKNVCKFKQKGGLGLKDLGVWNKAMIVKHPWHIVIDKESLWVKWINTEKLKGRNFWEIKEDKNDSWG